MGVDTTSRAFQDNTQNFSEKNQRIALDEYLRRVIGRRERGISAPVGTTWRQIAAISIQKDPSGDNRRSRGAMQGENIDIESVIVSRHARIPSSEELVRLTEKTLLGGWSEEIYRLVDVPLPHGAHSQAGESY